MGRPSAHRTRASVASAAGLIAGASEQIYGGACFALRAREIAGVRQDHRQVVPGATF